AHAQRRRASHGRAAHSRGRPHQICFHRRAGPGCDRADPGRDAASGPGERLTMQQPVWNFEQDPTDERMDETGYNLRAYFDRMADDKLREYSRSWSDQQLMDWDGNFKSDG